MKVYRETSLENYTTVLQARGFLQRIIDQGKANLLEAILMDMYPEGVSESELDDLLAYSEDEVCHWLGMKTENDLLSEIGDKERELKDLETDYERVCGNIKALEDTINNFPCTQNELDHYGEQLIDAQQEASELDDEITELKESLQELVEEYEGI